MNKQQEVLLLSNLKEAATGDNAARDLLEVEKLRVVNAKLLEACKHFLSAGIHQSTDFRTQSEAYFLAKAAIKQAEEV